MGNIDEKSLKKWAKEGRKRTEAKNIKSSKALPKSIDPTQLNTAIADEVLDRMDFSRNSNSPTNPDIKNIAAHIVDNMNCPLISQKNWNCNRAEPGKELSHPYYEKGKEPQCLNGGFCNCPAFRLYINFRISQRATQRSKEKVTKRNT